MGKVYEAVQGLDWPSVDGPVRVEAGDACPDSLPEKSIPWLLEQGLIRETKKKAAAKPQPVAEPKTEPAAVEPTADTPPGDEAPAGEKS